MKPKLLLFPADSIKNGISRSFFFAKYLSDEFDVYRVQWIDPQNGMFQNVKRTKGYTLSCFVKSLNPLIRMRRNPECNFVDVYAPVMTHMVIHRMMGTVLAQKLARSFNQITSYRLKKLLRPDVIFHGEGCDMFPVMKSDAVVLADVQDDFGDENFRNSEYQRRYGKKQFNRTDGNFTITKAAVRKMSGFYDASFAYLPNGAEIEDLLATPETAVANLRQKLNLEGKTVVSYIGGDAWYDENLVRATMAYAQERLPSCHFVIVGNFKDLKLPNATFTGTLPSRDTYPYYHLTDIGILFKESRGSSFLQNSMPLKIIQYSSLQKAVITPELSWLREEEYKNVRMLELTPEAIVKQIKATAATTPTPDPRWVEFQWPRIIGNLKARIREIRLAKQCHAESVN